MWDHKFSIIDLCPCLLLFFIKPRFRNEKGKLKFFPTRRGWTERKRFFLISWSFRAHRKRLKVFHKKTLLIFLNIIEIKMKEEKGKDWIFLWKLYHLHTFLHIKMTRWEMKFPGKWKCIFVFRIIARPLFFKHTKVLNDFSWKGKYSIMEILLCHLTLTERDIYVLCMRAWNIFSSCHHGAYARMIFRLFAHSSAVWKCIFPKRSVSLYFPSHLISTFQTDFLLLLLFPSWNSS